MQEINFEDIRKGDTIRREWTSGGITQTVEGVAHLLDFEGDWCVKQGGYLTDKTRTDIRSNYYLIDRPKPQLPTKPGSVLVEATLTDGRTVGPLILDRDGWVAFQGHVCTWLNPAEILSFTPGKIVEADQ